MKPSLFLTLAGLLFTGVAATSHAADADTQILKADFGLFTPSESGPPRFEPSKTVPLIENQGFGWIALLKTKKTTVKWREEMTLPAAPETWGDTDVQGAPAVSKDGKVSVLEREVEAKGGVIYNVWTLTSGDPKGHYTIRLIVEDNLERVFEFDVQ